MIVYIFFVLVIKTLDMKRKLPQKLPAIIILARTVKYSHTLVAMHTISNVYIFFYRKKTSIEKILSNMDIASSYLLITKIARKTNLPTDKDCN